MSSGTYWKYTQSYSILPGVATGENENIVIGPDTLINGLTVTKVTSINKPTSRDSVIADRFWSLSSESFIEYSSRTDTIGRKLLEFPIEPGKRWISREDTFDIIATDKKIEIDLGNYSNCVLITRRSGPSVYPTISRYFWKDGIGLLKIESDLLYLVPPSTQTVQLFAHKKLYDLPK